MRKPRPEEKSRSGSLSTIGIPRALYYFHYYPLWSNFLEGLGFQVIFSPPTNKEILEWGLLTCVDGACLPLKAYVGHAQALTQAGVDQLFVPELIGVWKREFICTSFLGLPDLLRQYLPSTSILLKPILDGRKGSRELTKCYWRFGRNYASRARVKASWIRAVEAQNDFEQTNRMRRQLTHNSQLIILVLGPRYLIDDPFLNGNLISHLKGLGVRILTPACIDDETSHHTNLSLSKPFFWSGARSSIGALDFFVSQLDGVINLTPFACGAQSLLGVVVEQKAITEGLPTLAVHLDEHTSELGILTRLEAFCDLLERKKHQ